MLRNARVLLWLLLMLGILCLVSSCTETEPNPLPTDPKSVAAMAKVRARLMAPESGRFRNVRQRFQGLYCGEVSGLNAAKEYRGWYRFAVMPDGTVLMEPRDMLPRNCR